MKSSSCGTSAMVSGNSSFEHIVTRQSPMNLFANFRARRAGTALPLAAPGPVRADVGWPWRMDWGGHDPASPLAEMYINYHNSGWGLMIFVCGTTFYLCAK